jgi:hypothetical protein
MPLIRIGYWHGDDSPNWPDPLTFVDAMWDRDERELVVDYLSHGLLWKALCGPSRCRFCQQPNGSLELTDGVYVWPEGLAHYVGEHSVRMPKLFVDHVRASLEGLEARSVTEDWWRSQRGIA